MLAALAKRVKCSGPVGMFAGTHERGPVDLEKRAEPPNNCLSCPQYTAIYHRSQGFAAGS